MERHTAPAKASRTGTIVGLFAVLTLLSCSFGWWYLWDQRQKPKRQAVALFTAIMHQDWKAIYPLIIISDEIKREAPDAETFGERMGAVMRDGVQGNRKFAYGMEVEKTVTAIEAEDVVIDGDKADVTLSYKMTKMGMRYQLRGTAHMVKQEGIWKFDMDTEKNLSDLMGKPVPNTLEDTAGNPIYAK